jgi:hydroxymethylglutaryl-CoA reductase
MAIEEPLVVAAASSAPKFIAENGGFNCLSTKLL